MMILNGNIIEDNKVILDTGFFFGRGLFETILVKDKPIFLDEHIDRINEGLKKLNINKIITKDYFMDNFYKLKQKNCALKLVVTEANTLFSTREIPYTENHYEKGFSLKLSLIKRNPESHGVYLKTLNYLDNIIEKETASKEGFDEVIFENTYGYIAEGSTSNIFFIKDNILYTPSIKCGLLNGIIRKWVISNFNVIEGNFTLKDILNSEGAFITNSLLGIMKVSSINNNNIETSSLIKEIKTKYDLYINKSSCFT
ncbi:aminotransferase class IV [Clostridium sp. SYSU_GA19001]|uniref:aminotransferase class IV n=1 Tax=Clostridium caldaquaticum TaxID=2940653 RepID=UPI002077511B|nr:aminotransferase class IV [Clostridium caldaquaticum]MCM8710923.1 aminotransferase class IV [Clostridium caldaquaticum]